MLQNEAKKKLAFSAVDEDEILDLGSDDYDDDDDVLILIATMCSVIRNHEKSG
jgi:hypothetical protein